MANSYTPIPGPSGLPFLGNILDVDGNSPAKSLEHLADLYAHHGEHNWEVAHRVLMPAFGPLTIRDMFDDMYDIAAQLVMKWAREGPNVSIEAADDFTRLTLDTLAFLPTQANLQYTTDIEVMQQVAKDLVRERRANPSEQRDILNDMLNGRDPKTGEGMSDASIVNNMITFLIAVVIGNGKYKLAKGDSIVILLAKAMKDPAVWGSDAEEFKPERMLDEEFAKLPKNSWKPFGNGVRGCIGRPFAWQEMLIVTAVLMQNFNFSMVNPGYDMQIKQTLTIKPKDFFIRASLREGLTATKLGKVLNSDDASNEAEASMLEDNRIAQTVTGKPMNLYYGSNTGTCEALARRLASDAVQYGYSAEVKELDIAMQNLPRERPVVIITASYEGKPPDNASHFYQWLSALQGSVLDGVSFSVFGCGHRDWQSTFQKIPITVDERLEEHGGVRLCKRGCADAATSDMYSDFDSWSESALWPAIFKEFGRTGLNKSEQSNLDVKVITGARASILGQNMEEGVVLESRRLTHPDVPLKHHIKFQLPEDMTYTCGDYLAVLPTNPPDVVSKALRRFNLPSDAILEVQNPHGLTPPIPLGVPVSVSDILSSYVELSQPACKRDINILARSPSCNDDTRRHLEQFANHGDMQAKRLSPLEILIKYPSIDLSIGEYIAMLPPMRPRQYSISSSPLLNPSECTISFSVISTPLEIDEGLPSQGKYLGVASNYLSNLRTGDNVHIAVKRSQSRFKPPSDIDVPVIMACAGSGIAPFRGFIMDRAEKIKACHIPDNATSEVCPAKAILYVGCRTQGYDDVYNDELAEWQELGAVETRWAYSRPATCSAKGEYVQDRILEDQEELVELFEKGAMLFICGSAAFGGAVRDTIKKVYSNERQSRIKKDIRKDTADEMDDEDAIADEWLNGLHAKERFATDVFT
ncbi:hypothetical protein AtubIFM54640_010728 [Aspergillus tubingensis]|nr:hypothetical protein AtubIFM54640_010728 [Aspergillus tubingensis]